MVIIRETNTNETQCSLTSVFFLSKFLGWDVIMAFNIFSKPYVNVFWPLYSLVLSWWLAVWVINTMQDNIIKMVVGCVKFDNNATVNNLKVFWRELSCITRLQQIIKKMVVEWVNFDNMSTRSNKNIKFMYQFMSLKSP